MTGEDARNDAGAQTDPALGDDRPASPGDSPATHDRTGPGGTGPGGTGGPHRRLLAALLLIAALGVLGLVTLGASAERAGDPVYVGDASRGLPSFVTREAEEMPTFETAAPPEQPPRPEGSGAAATTALIVLAVVLALVAAWVIHRMRKLARPAPPRADEADEDELTVTQVRAAFADARGHLSTVVEAHDAVIAAWLALERAIAAAGVRRRPSQTTLEFVVAVLATLQLDRSALDRLAHLYRRALFDDQPLIEADREEAIELLDRLTSDLDAPVEEGTG